MLDERMINAALMKAQGIDVIKIASAIGICRATYYNWEKMEDFKAEVVRLRQEFLTQASNMAAFEAPKSIRKLIELRDNAESEKIQCDAAKILLDKTIANMTKLSIDDGRDTKDNVSKDMLDEEIAEFESEQI
jgi:transcriptional regulator with XRE-family HTH domain